MYDIISPGDFFPYLSTGTAILGGRVNGDLQAIGKNFDTAVVVHDTNFDGSVNFISCRFMQRFEMIDCSFNGDVTFSNCHFECGCFFTKTSFNGKADFSNSFIKGVTYFWRARFYGEAIFNDLVVHPASPDGFGSIDPGEANFSWAHFTGTAHFTRTRFYGPACFWRTLFLSSVYIEETLFNETATFMGRESEVSIDLRELADGYDCPDRLYFYLEALPHRLINKDPEEHCPSETGIWHRFAQLAVVSEQELEQRLEINKVPSLLASRLLEAYRRDAKPMFSTSPSATSMISGIDLPPHATLSFMDIDMSNCRLLGTRMDSAQFCNVKWREKPVPFTFDKRLAVIDEEAREEIRSDDAPVPTIAKGKLKGHDLASLQRLYRELATGYEKALESQEASRFRISHREIARRRLSGWPRFFATVYRCLAMYGESPGIATAWLLFFVFLFFPLLYLLLPQLLTGASAVTFKQALVTSLEVTTFLKRESNLSLVEGFVAGMERVVMATQVTVFLLTIRRILPP